MSARDVHLWISQALLNSSILHAAALIFFFRCWDEKKIWTRKFTCFWCAFFNMIKKMTSPTRSYKKFGKKIPDCFFSPSPFPILFCGPFSLSLIFHTHHFLFFSLSLIVAGFFLWLQVVSLLFELHSIKWKHMLTKTVIIQVAHAQVKANLAMLANVNSLHAEIT